MNKINTLVAFGCLSLSFSHITLANTEETNTCDSNGDNIICSPAPTPLRDMACKYNGPPSTIDNNQTATYTIKNTEPAPFELYPIVINTNELDDFTGEIEFGANTTCPLNGGVIYAAASCNIVLKIKPPVCYPNTKDPIGPYNQILDRELFIGIYSSEQSFLSIDLQASVTPLGSAADFAILSNNTSLGAVAFNASNGMAAVVGNIGASSITGDYNIANGDPITTNSDLKAPRRDMLSAQQMFIHNLTLETCTPHGSIDGDDSFGPGSYCLEDTGGLDITVGGTASPTTPIGPFKVTAPGRYVFYVNAGTSKKCNSNTQYCNLTFNPNAGVTYLNLAKPENVDIYWVVGNQNDASGNVTIKTATTIPGTIITGGTISFDELGNDVSTVIGRLFTFDNIATAINVYGNKISIDPNVISTDIEEAQVE